MELIFLHINRTGGKTLRKVLRDAYDGCDVSVNLRGEHFHVRQHGSEARTLTEVFRENTHDTQEDHRYGDFPPGA